MLLSYEELRDRYEQMTSRVIVRAQAATPIVGGLTATDAGLRAFIEHHLKITDPVEAQKTFERMKVEELGEKPVPSETGELNERLTYGINVIRRTALGPYLASHMIHANIKNSMSRLGIFTETRGSKGNVAEAGIVVPAGISLRDDRPDCVYLMDPDGGPAKTYFEEFKGRVSSPQGSVSIIHHSECVPVSTAFEFEFRFIKGKMSSSDIIDMLALSMIVGIGSVKSLGNGKIRIISAEILDADKPRTAKAKEPKAPKAEKESADAKARKGEKAESAGLPTDLSEDDPVSMER